MGNCANALTVVHDGRKFLGLLLIDVRDVVSRQQVRLSVLPVDVLRRRVVLAAPSGRVLDKIGIRTRQPFAHGRWVPRIHCSDEHLRLHKHMLSYLAQFVACHQLLISVHPSTTPVVVDENRFDALLHRAIHVRQ